MIDLEAMSQMAMAQFNAEMEFFVAAMERAGRDEVIQLLVIRKLAFFAESNNVTLVWFRP